jgi:YesN/AraC family two-component response regulator
MSEQQPIRVMIVDDHLLVRDGLNLLLSTFDEIEVVGLAADGQEAITLYEQARPDVILMDLRMPGMGGIEAVKARFKKQTEP